MAPLGRPLFLFEFEDQREAERVFFSGEKCFYGKSLRLNPFVRCLSEEKRFARCGLGFWASPSICGERVCSKG